MERTHPGSLATAANTAAAVAAAAPAAAGAAAVEQRTATASPHSGCRSVGATSTPALGPKNETKTKR